MTRNELCPNRLLRKMLYPNMISFVKILAKGIITSWVNIGRFTIWYLKVYFMWVDYNTSISHFNGSSFRIRYKIKEVQTKYHKFNFFDPFIWFEESCNIMFGMWLSLSSPLPVISLDTNKCQKLDVCSFASQNRFQT